MAEYGADFPYKTIGWHLKFAREQLRESLIEAAGAVEIEVETLERIEQGKQRPSEDVLLLLINHLGLEDAEATSLWQLAGYISPIDVEPDKSLAHPAIDLRTVYTDMMHATINDYGVVMNFMQSGPNNQLLAVARVGMSKEHAKRIIEILQKTLTQSDHSISPKLLPSPQTHKKAKDTN